MRILRSISDKLWFRRQVKDLINEATMVVNLEALRRGQRPLGYRVTR